jgi:hypothetical protein
MAEPWRQQCSATSMRTGQRLARRGCGGVSVVSDVR